VLGGRVVGVGEEHMGVVVRSIERDRVVALWGHKILTYDLEDQCPREFRAESARRAQQASESEGGEPQVQNAVISDPDASDPSGTGSAQLDPARQTQTSKGQEKDK
jgi:hypothetical protein